MMALIDLAAGDNLEAKHFLTCFSQYAPTVRDWVTKPGKDMEGFIKLAGATNIIYSHPFYQRYAEHLFFPVNLMLIGFIAHPELDIAHAVREVVLAVANLTAGFTGAQKVEAVLNTP